MFKCSGIVKLHLIFAPEYSHLQRKNKKKVIINARKTGFM